MPDFTSSGCPLCSCQRSNPSPVTCFIGQGQRSLQGWLLASGLWWPVTVFLSAFKNYYHRWDVNGRYQKSLNQEKIVEWAVLCWDLRAWLFFGGFFSPQESLTAENYLPIGHVSNEPNRPSQFCNSFNYSWIPALRLFAYKNTNYQNIFCYAFGVAIISRI